MSRKATKHFAALAAAGILGVAVGGAPVTQAFNFGDMMNPGKWMGGGNDYDDWEDYGPGPYGPYGPGPYGAGPGPYGPPGYGSYGAGPYGGPRYGAPGYPGAGYGAAPPQRRAPAAPASSSENTKSAEIEALKRRIDELEAKQAPPSYAPPPATSDWGTSAPTQDWGSAPAFRPQGKY